MIAWFVSRSLGSRPPKATAAAVTLVIKHHNTYYPEAQANGLTVETAGREQMEKDNIGRTLNKSEILPDFKFSGLHITGVQHAKGFCGLSHDSKAPTRLAFKSDVHGICLTLGLNPHGSEKKLNYSLLANAVNKATGDKVRVSFEENMSRDEFILRCLDGFKLESVELWTEPANHGSRLTCIRMYGPRT